MSKRMTVEQDISAVWEHLVRTGQIRNRFTGSNGRQIESGMRMTAEGPQHYAMDLETGEEIRAGVMERSIEGSDFTLQWNQYRSLKPQARALGLGRQRDYSPDVNDCFFACQDPSNPLSLLRRNAPLQMTLRNFQWAAFHNALPVEKNGHFLWAPVRTHGTIVAFPHYLQVLTLTLLQDFLRLASCSANMITLFNSMHAGASVNHIHFHSVYCEQQMTIEKAPILSNGRHYFLDDYPASGLVYLEKTSAENIWLDVEKLQGYDIPLNLIHANGRTYLIPRNIEHEVVEEFPSGILAGMELAGKAITTEQSFYENADWATLQTALRKSTLRNEDMLRILHA